MESGNIILKELTFFVYCSGTCSFPRGYGICGKWGCSNQQTIPNVTKATFPITTQFLEEGVRSNSILY